MLPVHYSFYRYSLVGEGGFYALVHGFLACFFAAVYVLLFFAWVQRLTDAMFQLPILAVLGVVGASVVGLYLLVDLFYGTSVYGLAVIVCLAVSGVCWQACPLAAVRADERLRALPDAATVRVWVPLLADLACYVAAPALFGWLGFDAAAAVGGVLQVSALVLAAVSLVFLAGSLVGHGPAGAGGLAGVVGEARWPACLDRRPAPPGLPCAGRGGRPHRARDRHYVLPEPGVLGQEDRRPAHHLG